ncbi:hypothetical protein NECID01_0701 [Nematocida sp. AWRm77]|nr:hypothetical protein NECID01_0701 [Nematocida sp. AWRm77]
MQSEYEKERAKLIASRKNKSDYEAEIKNLSAAISEAESLDLSGIDPGAIAKELTAIEMKVLREISPVEILKFDPNTQISASSPMLSAYIDFTNSISVFVSSMILQVHKSTDTAPARSKDAGKDSKQRKSKGQAQQEQTVSKKYQQFWMDVVTHLQTLKNSNSISAIVRGIKKTPLSRVYKEEIEDLVAKTEGLFEHEAEEKYAKDKALYIRKVFSLEKHLIDACVNKKDPASAKKFRSIIEYISYIRDLPLLHTDKKINHALVSSIRTTEDVRIDPFEEEGVQYKGCFLFLERSNFISPME